MKSRFLTLLLVFFVLTFSSFSADNYRCIPDSARNDDQLVIGSWKIKRLGQSAPEKRDFETMADIIEEFDIFARNQQRDLHAGPVLLRFQVPHS